MLAPALPPPTPVTVSAAARLAYVLRHFALAYPGAPVGAVGYAGTQPQVEVANLSGDFFIEINSYPPAPNWREWQGQRVPFFFDAAPEQPLLVLQENKVLIAADIIAAAFYLLSGWQEYFSSARDRHGRFPYAASVQRQYGFVALPVVNYYFDVLKTALEYVSRETLQPRRWGGQQADFVAFISHDVDNLRSAWKAPAKTALRQLKVGRFGQLLWRHLTQPDAWDNLEAVAAATAQYGAKSSFFILPNSTKAANGTPNADYSISGRMLARLHKLTQYSCEINLHGSLGTATDAWSLNLEIEKIAKLRAGVGRGVRFHYLSWEPRQTPTMLAEEEIDFDTTLGFAEHFGFRNSYCQPFYPFDFQRGAAADFLEIPLNVMDATLHHPAYLQLAPADILPALQPVCAEIKKFGGVASVLWHNENFDPANTQNGPRQFHEIMVHLQQHGAAFLTGREIYLEFSREVPAPIPNF